jgi:hypothetical protein
LAAFIEGLAGRYAVGTQLGGHDRTSGICFVLKKLGQFKRPRPGDRELLEFRIVKLEIYIP